MTRERGSNKPNDILILKAVCATELVFLPHALIPLAGLTVTNAVSLQSPVQFRSLGTESLRPADPGRRFVRGGSLVLAPSGAENGFLSTYSTQKKVLGINA